MRIEDRFSMVLSEKTDARTYDSLVLVIGVDDQSAFLGKRPQDVERDDIVL
jgi:hypothetical protein